MTAPTDAFTATVHERELSFCDLFESFFLTGMVTEWLLSQGKLFPSLIHRFICF